MGCTPLAVQPGTFDTVSWSRAPSAAFDGKTLTRTQTQIKVSGGAQGSLTYTRQGTDLAYAIMGNKYLIILDNNYPVNADTSSVAHNVVKLADFTATPWQVRSLFDNGVPCHIAMLSDPYVAASKGNGSVFLCYAMSSYNSGSAAVDMCVFAAIRRSDNGAVLCGPYNIDDLNVPHRPTGEATTVKLIINYEDRNGGKHTHSSSIPKGKPTLSTHSLSFPDVAIGGSPPAPLTRSFTISNTGNDCLSLSLRMSNASDPFSPQPQSVALAPGSPAVTVTVTFSPTAVGSWTSTLLLVTPEGGTADQVACTGRAITPKVATPTFRPPAGAYTGSVDVYLECSSPGQPTIRYTTNGSEPGSSSTVYSGSPITVSRTTTIRARASQPGKTDSDTATATYTIRVPAVLDQEHNPVWTGGAVNIVPVNHVSQTFTPSLPYLAAVEVGLRTGNPGRGGDSVTLSISAQGGRLGAKTIAVPEGFDGFLRFDFTTPLAVGAGNLVTMELNDTGKNVFHWKYKEGTYAGGQAMFYGSPLVGMDFFFKTYGNRTLINRRWIKPPPRPHA